VENPEVFLRAVRGDDKGKGWELSSRQVYTIGRSRNCNIRLTDQTVSANHAKLECSDGVWFVVDLGSTHGVRVNHQKIATRKPLFDRDRVRLGKSQLEFREYEHLDAADVAEIDRGVSLSE
jgi:pSer/pThr/pTyr-binding forkhead associated (FHA) protein